MAELLGGRWRGSGGGWPNLEPCAASAARAAGSGDFGAVALLGGLAAEVCETPDAGVARCAGSGGGCTGSGGGCARAAEDARCVFAGVSTSTPRSGMSQASVSNASSMSAAGGTVLLML
jgi:hypothetical protein